MTTLATAIQVVMPQLTISMTEGTILAWLKTEGDHLAAGDDLVEIETDKGARLGLRRLTRWLARAMGAAGLEPDIPRAVRGASLIGLPATARRCR
jgi:hypothetical protein